MGEMFKNQKSNVPRRERLNGATCTAEVKPEVLKNPDVDGNVIVKRDGFQDHLMERFHVTRHLPKMVHMTKPKHSEQPENKYFEFLKMMTSSMQGSGWEPLPVGNLPDDVINRFFHKPVLSWAKPVTS